jgi:hypothetical protein
LALIFVPVYVGMMLKQEDFVYVSDEFKNGCPDVGVGGFVDDMADKRAKWA